MGFLSVLFCFVFGPNGKWAERDFNKDIPKRDSAYQMPEHIIHRQRDSENSLSCTCALSELIKSIVIRPQKCQLRGEKRRELNLVFQGKY